MLELASRNGYDSTLAWARAEYARISQMNSKTPRYPRAMLEEPNEKSALFARLLSGKAPLPFPPPTSFNQPWYDLIECAGPFDIQLGGMLPAWEVPASSDGSVFLEYLIINKCPWGVVNGNDAAALLSEQLSQLRACTDGNVRSDLLNAIGACLLQRPEWTVRFEPWAEYKVFLRRAVHQGKRSEIEGVRFFRHSLDGTNLRITRVLIDGAAQAIGKSERMAHLKCKPEHLRTPYERKALTELSILQADPSSMDWVEYEADTWAIQSLDLNRR